MKIETSKMQMSGKQPLAKKEKTLTEESFFLIERTVPGIDLLSPAKRGTIGVRELNGSVRNGKTCPQHYATVLQTNIPEAPLLNNIVLATSYSPPRSEVPSALRSLTALFGMGRGVPFSPESPRHYYPMRCRRGLYPRGKRHQIF